MFYELNEKQQSWADSTFSSMTMEEKAAQLLHPAWGNWSETDFKDLACRIPVGSVFAVPGSLQEMRQRNQMLQHNSRIPLLISADMENGTNSFLDHGVIFPFQMGIGACDNPEYAYQAGQITAKICRYAGVNWALSPVADLNLNPLNPIVNVRALGDRPEKIIPLLREIIRGIQEENRMAATCKHFPGDGVDHRDQHMLVSVNSLPFDQWEELYGEVWKSVIAAGVKSIMPGHISFPAWQGMEDDPDEALPATLSADIQRKLLRERLGFRSVIVSDAFPMIGFTCRFPEEELAWRNIAAGSDCLLFAEPERDFNSLMGALRSGKLSEERVEESAKRLIELKASLNLFEDCFGPGYTADDLHRWTECAQKFSDQAVTVLKTGKLRQLPIDGKRVKKVLTVTLVRNDTLLRFRELPLLDEELKKRGFEVDHLCNPSSRELKAAIDRYDRIFVDFNIQSHCGLPLRLAGKPAMSLWHCFFTKAPEKVVFTSFGTPYLLQDHPYLDHCYCVWGPFDVCQISAVRFWCGEIGANGKLPVKLPQIQIRCWGLE